VEACQPIQCGLEVAHRLQQLYNDTLRHFDQAYINSIVPLLRDLQTSDQVPFQSSQPLGQLYQPTEANYEALLANVISDLSLLTAEVMSTLPQFWSKSRVEFGAHRVLQRVIESLVQNRTYWQVSLRVIIDPSLQSIQDPLQRQRSRQRAIVCGIAHNIVQLTAKGRGQPSDTMMASSTTIGLSNTPLAGTVEKRRLSMEEIAIAKRWVHEQKRIAFARSLSLSHFFPGSLCSIFLFFLRLRRGCRWQSPPDPRE
jgi:hypothetical protein